MLLQFKNLILSIFMAANTNSVPAPEIQIENVDNITELSCLSQAIHGEASNQGLDGKLAVAHVIVNRSKDPKFPSDICSVIRQKNQFHFLQNIKWINVDKPAQKKQMTDSIKAASMVLNDEVADTTKGALYFINPKNCTDKKWLSNMRKTIKIQDHVFYKNT